MSCQNIQLIGALPAHESGWRLAERSARDEASAFLAAHDHHRLQNMAEALAADQGDVSAGAYETSRYQSYAAPTNANEFYSQSNSYAGAGDWTVNIMMFTVVVGYTILGVSLFFAWCVAALVTRVFLLSCNSPLTFRLLLPLPLQLRKAASHVHQPCGTAIRALRS